MRFYSEQVFPRLCDLALGRRFIARHRRELLASAAGKVLEIGVGTGLNLPCYPPHVRRIATVDPNPGMNRLAQKRSRRTGLAIDQHVLSGERLPFAAESFDCVVSTFTLCSIERVAEALGEICRVLRPGGRYLYRGIAVK